MLYFLVSAILFHAMLPNSILLGDTIEYVRIIGSNVAVYFIFY